MRQVIWKIQSGSGLNQQTPAQKIYAGLEYVETLRKEYNVLEVIADNEKITITIEDK